MHKPNEVFDFLYVAQGNIGIHLLDFEKAIIADAKTKTATSLGALRGLYLQKKQEKE
jgi:hypothetical protein